MTNENIVKWTIYRKNETIHYNITICEKLSDEMNLWISELRTRKGHRAQGIGHREQW
jgi:hypothetical protein